MWSLINCSGVAQGSAAVVGSGNLCLALVTVESVPTPPTKRMTEKHTRRTRTRAPRIAGLNIEPCSPCSMTSRCFCNRVGGTPCKQRSVAERWNLASGGRTTASWTSLRYCGQTRCNRSAVSRSGIGCHPSFWVCTRADNCQEQDAGYPALLDAIGSEWSEMDDGFLG
jgi:hypothetical protein